MTTTVGLFNPKTPNIQTSLLINLIGGNSIILMSTFMKLRSLNSPRVSLTPDVGPKKFVWHVHTLVMVNPLVLVTGHLDPVPDGNWNSFYNPKTVVQGTVGSELMANDVGEHHRLRGGSLLVILHIENNVPNRLGIG